MKKKLKNFSLSYRVDADLYSNLTPKIMKICEPIFKKDSAPIQFKFFELYKSKRSLTAPAIALRLSNKSSLKNLNLLMICYVSLTPPPPPHCRTTLMDVLLGAKDPIVKITPASFSRRVLFQRLV